MASILKNLQKGEEVVRRDEAIEYFLLF